MEWGTYSMAPFSPLKLFFSCFITSWGATLVKNTPIFYNLQDLTRYIWQKFPCCQNSTRGTSLSRLVSGFICSCAVRTTFWNGEPTGSVWTDCSETLLGGGGHPKATTFPGGPWDMRSPETAASWSTRGGRVGRTVPWRHRRETDTVKWGVDRFTSEGGGGGLIGLSPRASSLFSRRHLRNNNGPQIRFTLWRLRLSTLPVSPFLGGEAR